MADYRQAADYDPASAVELFDEVQWQKSFASEPNGGSCVEVNLARSGLVGVRDTKLEQSPVFVFDTAEWEAFLIAVKAGQFDLPADAEVPGGVRVRPVLAPGTDLD